MKQPLRQHPPRNSAGRGAALAFAIALAAGGLAARADGPVTPAGPAPVPAPLPPLPEGVVARVSGKDVTRDAFSIALARRLRAEATTEGQSAPATILEVVVRERALAQEATRLGIVVTKGDIDAEYGRQDGLVKLKSNGAQTLAELLKAQGENIAEFLANLHDYVLEEKLARHPSHLGDRLPKDDNAKVAQVLVVVGQIMQKAKVEKTGLPPGVIIRINDSPVTEEDFGKALLLRYGMANLRSELAKLCEARLVEDLIAKEGGALTEEALEGAIQFEKARYLRRRALDPRPEMQGVSYEEFMKWRWGRPIEEIRKDPQFRGMKALSARFRTTISDDDVRAEWVRNAKTLYGTSVFVTDVQVTFKVKGTLTEATPRRTRDEAMRIARDYERRVESGESAEKVLKEIRDKKDPSLTADPKRVQDVDNGAFLFPAVVGLKDGAWSPPVETLSEFHLMRRERAVEAAPLEQIKEDVREDLVQFKANKWLQEQMRDPNVVRMDLR